MYGNNTLSTHLLAQARDQERQQHAAAHWALRRGASPEHAARPRGRMFQALARLVGYGHQQEQQAIQTRLARHLAATYRPGETICAREAAHR